MILIPAVSTKADPFTEIKGKLTGISREEKEILQNLFTLTQDVELMESQEKEISEEIKSVGREIVELEAATGEMENTYEKKRKSLARVLQSYQRMGPGSFLEIILDSESLSALLHRINILRDLARNTGELLDELEASGKKLAEGKAVLQEKLALSEYKQKQLKEALTKKIKLKNEKEEYLSSLTGEREYYEEYLTDIERVWGELKPLVSETAKEFSRIMEEGSLPTDALKVNFSAFSIKGSIEDKIINKVISEQSNLPNMLFVFHPGKVEIVLPDKNFVMSGSFDILEGHILRFQAQEGSFFGMALEQGTIEELFKGGDLVLNLEPLLAGNNIHDLEIKEGCLELISKLIFF